VPSLPKVIITGANGFIGRHLTAAQLALDRNVVAIDQQVSNLDSISHNPMLTKQLGSSVSSIAVPSACTGR
jgi:nucleoside-diphosphate-sugar epimerase